MHLFLTKRHLLCNYRMHSTKAIQNIPQRRHLKSAHVSVKVRILIILNQVAVKS